MSFIPRIKPRDQYLRDFFRQESEDPMGDLLNEGDPYEPIPPERIIEMREIKSKERNKEIPGFWESFKHYSGIKGLGEIGDQIGRLRGFRPLAEDFPRLQKGAESIADVIEGDVQGQAYEKPIIDPISARYNPGLEDLSNIFGTATPFEAEAGIRGFGAGLVENPLKRISAVDLAPFGRAAKFAAAAGKMTRAGEGLAKGLKAASSLKGAEKGSLLLESPEYLSKALQGSAEGLQGLERASGVGQGFQAAAQIPRGAENIAEGNYAEGIPEFVLGISGAALVGRSGFENFLTPELIAKGEKGINDITSGRITPESLELVGLIGGAGVYGGMDFAGAPLAGGILSHGRYMRPEETEPVNPKLIERSELPFQEANRQFLENESMQDQFDVLRRMEDVVQRNVEPRVPEYGGNLEGITFDPGLRGGNLGGQIRINTEAIARQSPDFESYLSKLGNVITHEGVHEKGLRPHGQELIEDAAWRVVESNTPDLADIELGQTLSAMPENIKNFREDLPESRTRPFEDLEGNYVPEPTNADFAFRTTNEAAQNAARLPVEELIQGYLENPNDRATLEHAYLMQRGERPRGSNYRDYFDEALDSKEELANLEKKYGRENLSKVFPSKADELLKQVQEMFPPKKLPSNDDLINRESQLIEKNLEEEINLEQLNRWESAPKEEIVESNLNRETYRAWLDKGTELDKKLAEGVDRLLEMDENTLEYQQLHREMEKTQDELWRAEAQVKKLGSKSVPAAKLKNKENLSRNIKLFFEGQPVEIIRRRGNSVTIRMPDGTEKVVGSSRLRPGVEAKGTTEQKGQYEDLTKELEALEKELGGEAPTIVHGTDDIEKVQSILERGLDPESHLGGQGESYPYQLVYEKESTNIKEVPHRPGDYIGSTKNKPKEIIVAPKEFIETRSSDAILKAQEERVKQLGLDPTDPNIDISVLENDKELQRLQDELEETMDKEIDPDWKPRTHQDYKNEAIELGRKYGIPVYEGRITEEGKTIKNHVRLDKPTRENPLLQPIESKHITEQLSDLEQELTIDPSDVSVVAEDKHIFPEYATPTKPGRPGKQGPPKPPKELLENVEEVGGETRPRRLGDTEPFGAFKGENVETQELTGIKRSIEEGKPIEKAQAGEIIKDQSFRDQIHLQDQILKEQELEALKAGDAEKAQKVAMERKIFRAQNAEEFAQYKRQTKEEAQDKKDRLARQRRLGKEDLQDFQRRQKEQLDLQDRILKAQQAEELELQKLTNNLKNEAEVGPKKPERFADFFHEAMSFARSLRSSFDIGPITRQSRSATLAHPIKALKYSKKAIQAYFSPKKSAEIEKYIFSLEKFKPRMVGSKAAKSIANESGLKLIGTGFDPGAEIHGSYYAPKVPVLGAGVRAAERSSQAYINLMRSNIFNQLTKNIPYDTQNKPRYEAAANAANLVTGRGHGNKLIPDQAIPFLNSATWGIRHQLAKYQQFTKTLQSLVDPSSKRLPANVRMEYLRNSGALLGTGITALGVAGQLGAEVDLDQQSPDFLSAKWGNKIWKPFGAGTVDAVRAIQVFGGRKSGNQIKKGVGVYTDMWFNPETGTGRLSPLLSGVSQAITPGEYAQMPESGLVNLLSDDPSEFWSKAIGQIEPLNITGIAEAIKDVGPYGALLGVPMSLGESLDVRTDKQFHEEKKEPKKRKKKRTGKVLSSY